MSKERKKRAAIDEPGRLPEVLATLTEAAADHALPDLDDATAKQCPRLFELLLPRQVPHPTIKVQGTPKLVWREPLLSIVWDRSVGAYRWTLTDRVLNFRVSGNALALPSLVLEIETAIMEHRVSTKEIKPA